MQAIRLHPSSGPSKPYCPKNPAPASALVLDTGLTIPKSLKSGEILVKIEATTVIRDALTWSESYLEPYQIPGNDFAGRVVDVGSGTENTSFQLGDEVYGMTDASKAGTWAQYAVVSEEETAWKPRNLTRAQATAVPLSGLTAYQALFEHAGLPRPSLADLDQASCLRNSKGLVNDGEILVTSAAGGVGLYIVQLAKLTDYGLSPQLDRTREMGRSWSAWEQMR